MTDEQEDGHMTHHDYVVQNLVENLTRREVKEHQDKAAEYQRQRRVVEAEAQPLNIDMGDYKPDWLPEQIKTFPFPALPPGTIVLPTGEVPRHNSFFRDLIRLMSYNPQATLRWNASVDICFNLNDAIRRRPPQNEWIWVIGDDHTFQPDVIWRLFRHHLPVVVPLCLKRSYPHHPVIYGGNHAQIQPGPQEHGLKMVYASGSAGMLIRESVLSAIKQPWFEFLDTNDERAGEDLMFCKKVREAGIPIYCDLDTWIGHITPVEVWPQKGRNSAGYPEWSVQYRNNCNAQQV